MKKIITLISAVLVLSAVATASTGVNSNVEISTQKNITSTPLDMNACDILIRLLGGCRSSQTLSFEN
ncbi:MAG: hypothetical protein KAG56_04885 [Sulfurovaceae bacterium]|nr:hypothetical protein [Sulfurovaceae bacterium]